MGPWRAAAAVLVAALAAGAVAAGLRGGARFGAWTVRAALGAGLGGPSVHAVPARAQLALLRALGPGGGEPWRVGALVRLLFELDAD